MGIFSILVAVSIGAMAIVSINKNSKNNEIESIVNEINVFQMENIAIDAEYQYYLEQDYLERIFHNLEAMTQKVGLLKNKTSEKYKTDIDKLLNSLAAGEANYKEFSELAKTRSFHQETGMYAQYSKAGDALSESFSALIDKGDWLELKWIDAHMWTSGEHVFINGKEYVKLVYEGPIPEKVKRDFITFRIGGTLTYNKNCYITDVKLINKSDTVNIDLSSVDNLSGTGLAYIDSEITTFDEKPSIRVGCNFNAANECWEEFAAQISVKEYECQSYSDIMYTLYLEPGNQKYDYKYGGSYLGVYSFDNSLEQLKQYVSEYSKCVVEGKDTSEIYGQIEMLFTNIEKNIPLYTENEKLVKDSLNKLHAIKEILSQMKELDDRMLVLKADNIQLNNVLTDLCSSVKNIASEEAETVKSAVQNVSILMIIVSSVILVGMTALISISINKNVTIFRDTLSKITQGFISLRIMEDGKDEFSQFGKSLNMFLDKLQDSINHLQKISTKLAASGSELENEANRTKGAAETISSALNEVTRGAGSQAEDISSSSMQISNMQENMLQITDSVNHLSEASKDVEEKGTQATKIIGELSRSSDISTNAFKKIAEQIYKTDGSVIKIQEIIHLIADIADRTNLLSLNASIEAARAGDVGKGFTVVASEIQKLAEQINSSAKIIDETILLLSEESHQTVQAINEVTNITANQKDKLNETKTKFHTVEKGILSVADEMKTVLQQADVCGRTGGQVVKLMTNLSTIAEENVAITHQTSDSMDELNDATVSLAKTALELKHLSLEVNENLNYFQ